MLECLGKRRQLAKLGANGHRQLPQFHPYGDLKTSPKHQGTSLYRSSDRHWSKGSSQSWGLVGEPQETTCYRGQSGINVTEGRHSDLEKTAFSQNWLNRDSY